MSKLVVIIQCDLIQNRCSGYNCSHAFFNKEGAFAGYADDTRYITFTCGGCAGVHVGCKLQNLMKRIRKFQDEYDEIVIHLASCIVSHNFHHPRCPHKEYIQEICENRGFKVVKGSYISKGAQRKREAGIYPEF